jgi:hypothetical protein
LISGSNMKETPLFCFTYPTIKSRLLASIITDGQIPYS